MAPPVVAAAAAAMANPAEDRLAGGMGAGGNSSAGLMGKVTVGCGGMGYDTLMTEV